MKPLLSIAAAAAALAGACSTSPLDREPAPSTVTFELRNDSVPALYLFQNCLLDLTITALAEPVHVALGYTHIFAISRDTQGKSEMVPDSGGFYRQTTAVFDTNIEVAF